MSISFRSNLISSSTKKINLQNGTRIVGDIDGNVFTSGRVGQTVTVRYDTKSSWSVPVSSNTIVTAMNVTITPKYNTSKILLTYVISYETTNNCVWRLGKNGTEFVRNTTDGSRWSGFAVGMYDGDVDTTPASETFLFVDSPATTSAITYNLMIGSAGASASTLQMNRPYNSAGADAREAAISYVIAQEIY